MKKAIQLYEQAASKGYPVANYVLGKNYTGGTLGLKQDLGKAKQYLERASAANFDEATVDLAILLFAEGTTASDQQALKNYSHLLARVICRPFMPKPYMTSVMALKPRMKSRSSKG